MSKPVRLGDIAEIVSGGTPSRSQAKYWGGSVPWVKTAQIQNGIIYDSDIDEYITEEGQKNSSAKMIQEGAILMAMYGQGKTRGQVAILGINSTINQACAAIRLKDVADRDFVFQQLLFRYKYIRALSNSGSQENLSSGLIKEIYFPLPELKLQTAIASILSTWDEAIEKMERLIEAKKKKYNWLLSRLVTNPEHPRRHVRDFIAEVSDRNRDTAVERVLSVTNYNGFVLPAEHFARRVASSDLSNYKVVSSGQYAYNPSRINVGSIARLDGWDKGVLSPMYVLFKVNEKKVNSDFFLHWLSSHEAKERIRKSAQGSVRETVSFTDLGAIPFPLPLMSEQERIAETLNTARQEINLLRKQFDAYRRQKRGLMQKLLTGEWRVRAGKETC